jgi:hypothetical protein
MILFNRTIFCEFFYVIFFQFYYFILCWLKIEFNNLFCCGFYMVIAISKQHSNIELVLDFMKKYFWFYCLQKNANEGTNIESFFFPLRCQHLFESKNALRFFFNFFFDSFSFIIVSFSSKLYFVYMSTLEFERGTRVVGEHGREKMFGWRDSFNKKKIKLGVKVFILTRGVLLRCF